MPFYPIETPYKATDRAFPRVTPEEQAGRDADAARIVADELASSDDPEEQAILTKEYRLRFGVQPPIRAANGESQQFASPADDGETRGTAAKRGFIPMAETGEQGRPAARRGFIPLASDAPERPSLAKTIALENPLTAIAETGMNLASQAVALPVAGLAGIGAAAGHALGLTEKTGADVVHAVGEALTYQPRGELGKATTDLATKPFQWLAEAGQHVGGKTLDATGSPVLATAVDTAINALPMAINPAVKGMKAARGRMAEVVKPDAPMPDESGPGRGFIPLEQEAVYAQETSSGARRLAADAEPLSRPDGQGLEELRGAGSDRLPSVAEELSAVPGGRWTEAGEGPTDLVGPGRNTGELRAGERGLVEAPAADQPSSVLSSDYIERREPDHPGSRASVGDAAYDLEAKVAPSANRTGTSDHGGAAAVSQELPFSDLPGANAERPGMGETPGHPGKAPAGALAERLEPGTGNAARVAERAEQQAPEGAARLDPLKTDIDRAAHEAATSPLNDKPQPSPGQLEAGTYAKGHVRIAGLDISIENPKGSVRSGISPEGRPWQSTMEDHYGYVKRTLGKDGDPVDVFIADKPSSQRVFVVDQIDPRTGKFDEHKAILGTETLDEAKAIYQRNYEPGWRGAGAIKEMSLDEFKSWVRDGDTRKPLAIRSVLGKAVTELSDSTLAKMTANKGPLVTSGKTRAIVEAEVARRELVASKPAPSSAAPIDGNVARLDARRVEPPALPATAVGREARKLREAIDARGARGAAAPASQRVQDMATGAHNAFAPGGEYVGFIKDTPPAGTATPASAVGRGKPIRREDILVDFAKALGTSIYEGRVKGKNRLGFFRPKLQETRIKRHADLETAAHEMAHLIDDRMPEVSQAWKTDKVLEKELRAISYDQTKVNEGFAEGVRLWMTQPDALQAKAPKVFAWLEQFANKHEYGPAMRKAQAGMTEWFGQDAIDRARSKIGEHRPLSDALDGMWDRFRQSVSDDLHGIYRMERELQGGKLAPVGAYESARLSRASASIADGAVRYGYPVKHADGSFTYKGKGLEEILKPLAESMDDALLYFVGRSSRELLAQGREHLFTPGEVDAMVRLHTPEREAAFKEYQAWNSGILDFAEAQGVINPEARRLWQRTQYLPFHRVGQPGGLKGKPGDWQGVQALTGGTENIRDVLGNMVSNAAMLIDKAVKNEARLKIAELAGKEGGGKFMAKIDTEARPVKVASDQVLEAMLERYGIAIDGNAPAFFEFLIHGQPPAGGNVVAVLKGGKPVWYEVADPILYRSLQAIDRPPMQWLTKWLGMPKRVGQATITLTPDFMLANIARDTLMGAVMSRSGFRPVIDSLQGMRLRMTEDPLYRDYIANGGGLSSIYLDEGKLRHKLEKFYTRQGIDYRTVLDTPDKLLSFIETLGDAFEMSTRMGEYSRAIKAGEHPRHAAYQGREVSTDFAMRGDSKALGFMYDTVMFLRPAVVSMDRLYRGVAHDPNKAAIGAKSSMIALASVGLYLLNRDDPRYQDLNDWDRDANWHFFVGGEHFRYPKIWEIGAVASVAERTTEKLMQEDPQGLGKDFTRIVGHTFNLNFMPQIVAPLAEQATNRNSFTKAPLETPGMENVQPFLRAKPNTSETMKALGMATRDLPESMQLNPVRAEALLRGYLNTWGMYGLMLSDRTFFGDKLPETRTDQLPVLRRFYSQEPPLHTKFETQFYDMLGEAKRLQGTLKELDRIGRSDVADEKEKGPMAGEAKPLERAAKNLQGINADMRQVRRDDAMTPAEKRQRLDALTVERNALLKAAVQDAEAAQKVKAE